MGYMRNHAIVVTGDVGYPESKPNRVERAHAKALELFDGTQAFVSEITPQAVNGHRSFFVAPDGSKEGWEESDACDTARAAFVKWLRDDPDFHLEWVEIQFGDDDAQTRIVHDSDEGLRDALG